MIDVFLNKIIWLQKYWPIRYEDEWYMRFCNEVVINIQDLLKYDLHDEDFTAALEIVKEAFPRHYYEITGYANF